MYKQKEEDVGLRVSVASEGHQSMLVSMHDEEVDVIPSYSFGYQIGYASTHTYDASWHTHGGCIIPICIRIYRERDSETGRAYLPHSFGVVNYLTYLPSY